MTKSIYTDHPINTYIKKYLGITVDQFCSLTGYPQSTLATWVSRNRRIEVLPINFFDAVSIISNKTIDYTYKQFLALQDEHDRYIHESLKIAKNTESLYTKSGKEAQRISQIYKKTKMLELLIKPSKTLKKSLDKKNRLLLIEALLEIYANVGELFPKWLLEEAKKEEHFHEIGVSFYNHLVIK